MVRTEHSRLLSFLIGSSGYLVPRPFNEDVRISKTMHPYLLGKRNIYYFYNLEKSLYGIRATLEVLKKIILSEGKILFVSDYPLLKICLSHQPDISYIKWKRSYLVKSKDVDLVFLSDIEKENLVEAHRKCLLLVGVGSPTMSKVTYPFNLNIESPLLSSWFFSLIYMTCVKGSRMKSTKKKRVFSSLLGKAQLKGVKKESRNALKFKGESNNK
uniref:Ribosomal protein S2 n=16 Tax=Saccharina TaxID=309357 RepID=F8UWK7_9PHAE|nr:ribosomal protein S2 [Saccharina japonica]YP_003288929.1 ribosomal protein S2 [Saccharina religiosa]YP_003288967.1 ribosomal protein S2 [Saccharina ochotensis]YP_003289044.1 ribosomal protein S2 [Saccharina diabolica]YP_003289095.1 ribosomal protein S2 [Saccharina longipedalis]YP_004598991.1 ribosomal protein S2 [Saccharina japonica x Saccharina latissima]YP_008145606.1 ribosomal protein S2 [Saccharina longissima]YP_009176246.1 ribosomal protein S2 [Saccharina sp. ye-B]YP_009176589.1 rib